MFAADEADGAVDPQENKAGRNAETGGGSVSAVGRLARDDEVAR